MKSSARGLAERLYDAGRIARSRRNTNRKHETIIQIEAADMIMALVCKLHREQRLRRIWQTLAYTSGAALFTLVALLWVGLSA